MNESRIPFPLESLSEEHRLIRKVTDGLEGFVEQLEQGEPAELEDLGQFAAFFADFCEANHHTKEEHILLPVMVKGGFDWQQGAVARVREEHAQEQYLVRVLKQAAQQESDWNEEARRHAIASIRALIDFQRRHLDLEERFLFPAAAERLSSEELSTLAEKLRDFDERTVGDGERARFASMAQRLGDKYAARA